MKPTGRQWDRAREITRAYMKSMRQNGTPLAYVQLTDAAEPGMVAKAGMATELVKGLDEHRRSEEASRYERLADLTSEADMKRHYMAKARELREGK